MRVRIGIVTHNRAEVLPLVVSEPERVDFGTVLAGSDRMEWEYVLCSPVFSRFGLQVDPAPRRPGLEARLVPVGDVGALTESLGTLLADPGQRARMGAAARAFAGRYGPEAIVPLWEGLFEEILEERPERAV